MLRFRLMNLKPTLLVCLATVALTSLTGCNLFRKNKKPKESPAIAGHVEAEFRQRWIDRRTPELVAQGVDASAARQQAETEFREKYPYLKTE